MADPTPRPKILPLLTWRSAIADSDLTPTQRHVCLAISLYMNEKGGSAFPGSARLAHDTGLHIDTVKSALRSIVKSDWLRVVKKGGTPVGGVRFATVYAANLPVDNDRGSYATGGLEWHDRGSSLADPGVEDAPISSLNSSGTRELDFHKLAETADPECFMCWGKGFARNPRSGNEGACECTKPLAAIEERETA